jgi:hypothetical protein
LTQRDARVPQLRGNVLVCIQVNTAPWGHGRSGLVSELLNLKISTVEELAHECVRFHDFPFDLEAQSFDSLQHTWTGTFVRRTSDPTRIVTSRPSLFVKVTEFPLVASRVTIRNVAEAEIQDRAQIGTYTFRQVHPTAFGCRFEFHQDCDISIDVDGPFLAEVCDVRELAELRGRVVSVGFVDFGIDVGAV